MPTAITLLSDLADSLFRVGSILRRAYGAFQTHRNHGHYSDRLLDELERTRTHLFSEMQSMPDTVGQRLRLVLASLFLVTTLVAIGAMAGAVTCP